VRTKMALYKYSSFPFLIRDVAMETNFVATLAAKLMDSGAS